MFFIFSNISVQKFPEFFSFLGQIPWLLQSGKKNPWFFPDWKMFPVIPGFPFLVGTMPVQLNVFKLPL